MEEEITCSFQKNQVVWAKVHGYPWWPAIVNIVFDKKA